MMLSPLLSILTALVMTMAGIVILKPLSIRLGLVDKPGGRKLHEGNVPLIGGIAMFFGFGFSLLNLIKEPLILFFVLSDNVLNELLNLEEQLLEQNLTSPFFFLNSFTTYFFLVLNTLIIYKQLK